MKQCDDVNITLIDGFSLSQLDPDLQLKNDPLYQALILESNTTTRILLHDPRGDEMRKSLGAMGLSSSRRDAAGKARRDLQAIESDPFIIRVTVQNFLNLTAGESEAGGRKAEAQPLYV